MTKKIITSMLALASIAAQAQVSVSDLSVIRSGDCAEVLFKAKVDGKAVKSNNKLTLTPIITAGGNSEKLASIVIEGRRRRVMDLRNKVTHKAGSFVAANGQTVSYRSSIPYADWLQGASVSFQVQRAGCGSEQSLIPHPIAQNITVQGTKDPAEPDILSVKFGGIVLIVERNAPLPEKLNATTPFTLQAKLNELTIDFKVGGARLDPYSHNNYKILDELIKILRSSKDVLSGKIDITGYSSPDGIERVNYELAQERALAVRNYILDNVSYLRPANFNIVNGGENWEGLRKLVEESTMPGRWQVLDIIDHTPAKIDYVNNTSRKKQLMDLNGGQTWNYMLKNFFPQLRIAASVAIYKTELVDKSNASFTVQNAEIISRAVSLIGERKASEALAQLYKVENDPRAWNPIGVCFILLENTEKAKEYFGRAIEAGYDDAKMNLDQVK